MQDKASNQQKVVYMSSTCHCPIMERKGKTDPDGAAIIKPGLVETVYIKHIGGVDQQLHGIQF